jgi:hypothetical protein
VGDYVSFIEVEGMEAINKKKDTEPFRICDVVNLKKFKISLDTRGFPAHTGQGIVENVKVPEMI